MPRGRRKAVCIGSSDLEGSEPKYKETKLSESRTNFHKFYSREVDTLTSLPPSLLDCPPPAVDCLPPPVLSPVDTVEPAAMDFNASGDRDVTCDSPTMPLLTPEVPLSNGELSSSCLEKGMPLLLRAYKEPEAEEDQGAEADNTSEKSEGDSGKENEECTATSTVKWRGSRSSLTSRGSRSSLTSRSSLASRGSRPRSGPFNQLNIMNSVVINTNNKQVKDSDKKTVQGAASTTTTRTTRTTTRLQSKKNLLSCQETEQQQVLSSPSADTNSSSSPTKAVTSTDTATTTTDVVATVLTNQTTVNEQLNSSCNEQLDSSCTEQLTARSAQLTIQSDFLTSPPTAANGAAKRFQMNSNEKLIINQTKFESPRSPVKNGRSTLTPASPMSPHKIQMPERRTSVSSVTEKLKNAISASPKAFSTKFAAATQQKRSTQNRANGPAKPKGKAEKLAQAAEGSRSITEFFTIRRSERKKKSELDNEWMESIEARLLATEDTDLPISVQEIEGKGRGVVAGKEFSRGDFVVEYAGELIDLLAAKEKESEYSQDITKGCYMYYFNHRDKQYCIDATEETGRYGRLLNHSCKTPNCVTKVVMLPNQDEPRLILVAKQDIEEGTELLYDYGDRSKESLKAHPWLSL